jgi:hypothetical protein
MMSLDFPDPSLSIMKPFMNKLDDAYSNAVFLFRIA